MSHRETKCRVLVVEDDEDDAKELVSVLEGKFEVDLAVVYDEAVAKLASRHYDAIISDYVLPYKDGLALIEEALGKHSGLAGILVSGHREIPEVVKADLENRMLVIWKPFDPRHLLAWVENTASNCRLRRTLRDLGQGGTA